MFRNLVLFLLAAVAGQAATTLRFYFGHAPVPDKNGVIAPWYSGQNGQCDYRVRIAAETLKRYPWSHATTVPPAPEYVYSGLWKMDDEGKITAMPVRDWDNGDLGQRSAYLLTGLVDYYRYSGDPAVFTPLKAIAQYLTGYCQTDASAPWPRMIISVPTHGKYAGACLLGPSEDLAKGDAKIQLDIAAEIGIALLRAYQLTGERSWFDTAKHWADLMAARRDRTPGAPPWGRYASKFAGPSMNGIQAGGIVYLLTFFDELIRLGYTGQQNALLDARAAGVAYLRDNLLPTWYVDDTWGRNYWDWEDPVQAETTTDYAVNYLLDHKSEFPNWKNDARNILAIFLNHTSADPGSGGEVYHGAWAYPESSSCCGRSLWYATMQMASVFARYGVEADSEWSREIARRSQLLATYDPLPNGQSMDLIDGGAWVNLSWFKIAHPMALKHVLVTMGWLPAAFGAARENHILRSTAVVRRVTYSRGGVTYSTFDAPAPTTDVLRLAFTPESVTANRRPLARRDNLDAPGYTVQPLPSGDTIVTIRHDAATEIAVTGPDPQQVIEAAQLRLDRAWRPNAGAFRATTPGAAFEVAFTGNQVRLIAPAGLHGGLADVYIDDLKQLAPVDFYSPIPLDHQVLYYRNGLTPGPHRLRLVARGQHNPVSQGNEVAVEQVQFSAATAAPAFGEGGGPPAPQRMMFGYPGRPPVIGSHGPPWLPGLEFVARTGGNTDVVAKTWYTLRQSVFIADTPDPELYRYGIHWPDLIINATTGPGAYTVRLKFSENEFTAPGHRAIDIAINGKQVAAAFDPLAAAKAPRKAVDLVFPGIAPTRGVIEIRLSGRPIQNVPTEAILQALEITPETPNPAALPAHVK